MGGGGGADLRPQALDRTRAALLRGTQHRRFRTVVLRKCGGGGGGGLALTLFDGRRHKAQRNSHSLAPAAAEQQVRPGGGGGGGGRVGDRARRPPPPDLERLVTPCDYWSTWAPSLRERVSLASPFCPSLAETLPKSPPSSRDTAPDAAACPARSFREPRVWGGGVAIRAR